MERVTVAAIFADQEKLGGQTVTVCGWARTIRDMKTFGFIELNDEMCIRDRCTAYPQGAAGGHRLPNGL